MATSGAVVLSKLSAPVLLQFEPVGRWYESRDARVRLLSGGSGGVEDAEGVGDESEGEEVNPLLLDPTKWKDQDHYAMLGLGKLRYKASAQDIRKAYRQKVLQHHPDKQDQDSLEGDDRFKCIKIAYDILSVPKRRRAYDSIDPTFDDSIPPPSTHSRENFFEVFGPVFEENSRWSTRAGVPALGDINSSLEEVETFYAFWYDFDSWREFSYLDEENREKAECREERRWMEKQNKAARQRRKKEEMARIRTLVDTAYGCDPRVRRFKEAEKAEKLARKRAKDEATRREILERERERQRQLQEERELQEKREEEARAQAAQAKKEKEVQKKAVRKEKKKFRDTCKAHGYFVSGEREVAGRMEEVERLCDSLSVERLREVNEKLSRLSAGEACALFEQEVVALKRREQEEITAAQAKASQSSTSTSSASSLVDSNWSREELQVLVKAVTLYPAGTVRRWEAIAEYVNAHCPDGSKEKTARQVVTKVKALQKLDSSEKVEGNKAAFSRFEQEHAKKGYVEADPTERYDAPKVWTAEEQKLLEKGLRTYPASTPDRWEKIAELIPFRSKAECIARFKELVAQVKAKKQQSS